MNTELSEQAKQILTERYLQRFPDGTQETPDEMFLRVAYAIALADKEHGASFDDIGKVSSEFYDIMINGEFIPNSPTLMNAGLDNGLQFSACYVLPVEDSIEGIFETIKNGAHIHKSGGGTGFSFSRLRPNGSRVNASGGVASGPVSFMKVFDSATNEIKQGGRRRGANMGVLRVDHPDIEEFITCKLDGGITNFNISVAITEAFMKSLENDADYDILAQAGWPKEGDGHYEGGEVIGRKNSRAIWDRIIDCAWQRGDPGLLFIDRFNEGSGNPTPELQQIEATNPCGEVGLFPNEACNLGSINLAKFVAGKIIDWPKFVKVVKTAVHFLDNVITVNPYPLPEIDKAVKANRRIGLGVMGWADMLFKLGIAYDSNDALELAEEVMETIQRKASEESLRLGKERGKYPNIVHSRYTESQFRNSTLTAIAPTGSISIIAGCSSGIEPAFALAYRRTMKSPDGDKVMDFVNPVFEETTKAEGFWSKELMAKVLEQGTLDGLNVPTRVKDIFTVAHHIEPHWHVRMQAAFQKYTDNGVSKTVNLPKHATRQEIEEIYFLADQTGCKGITVFRDGCLDEQVLNVGIKETEKPTPKATMTLKMRPTKLHGNTYRKKTPIGTAYITVNANGAGDKEPFEVFINVAKAGSDVAAEAEGLGRLISLILRLPGPLSSFEKVQDIIGQLRGIGSGRAMGFGKQRVMSLPDAVAQVLAEHVGLETTDDLPGLPEVDESGASKGVFLVGDLCPDCGLATFLREEGCKKCYNCGYSEC